MVRTCATLLPCCRGRAVRTRRLYRGAPRGLRLGARKSFNAEPKAMAGSCPGSAVAFGSALNEAPACVVHSGTASRLYGLSACGKLPHRGARCDRYFNLERSVLNGESTPGERPTQGRSQEAAHAFENPPSQEVIGAYRFRNLFTFAMSTSMPKPGASGTRIRPRSIVNGLVMMSSTRP